MAEPTTDGAAPLDVTTAPDMTAVRRLRADAPVPGAGRLDAAHRRLLTAVAAAGPVREARRGPVLGRRLAAVGAVAAVVAAALLASLVARTDRAAPVTTPRADQWAYHEIRYDFGPCRLVLSSRGLTEVGYADPVVQDCSSAVGAREDRTWARYDGTRQAVTGRGADGAEKTQVWPTRADDLAPREADAIVAGLPDDPRDALRLIRERSAPDRSSVGTTLTPEQRDFVNVVEVLAVATAVPAGKARLLHRVITGLAGAGDPVRTTDGAGRKVLAVGVGGTARDAAWRRNSMQVLLDAETFAYRGVRWVAALDYRVGGAAGSGPLVLKGTVIGTATRTRTVVVDREGERD
ncbi:MULTISPECIES: hypothetical protein [unclassified Streptomyces]|uniref:hypothetical protein n=1 Tax=unclassified Streptomyces TaxID=2593676 RepID=UPI0038054F4F